jgi:hypothetical protein
MACPGGCTNGGGQIKVDDPLVAGTGEAADVKPGLFEQKAWLAQVDEAYFSGESSDEEVTVLGGPNDLVDGISPSFVKDTLAHWSAVTGIELARLAYTSYREVVSDVGKTPGDTERVIEIAGKIGGGW